MLPDVTNENLAPISIAENRKTQLVKIKSINFITHDTLRIITPKPEGFSFIPGQAAIISINKDGWKEQKRPFTMTNLPDNGHLEFMIKTYPEHKGFTNQLLELNTKDGLILHNVIGTIAYAKEGTFIAGGSGVTPFISILRSLERKNQIGANRLILANKRKNDIILEEELNDMLGAESFINILADEKRKGYHYGTINEDFLRKTIRDFSKQFYLCGPTAMVESISALLIHLGAKTSSITKEMASF